MKPLPQLLTILKDMETTTSDQSMKMAIILDSTRPTETGKQISTTMAKVLTMTNTGQGTSTGMKLETIMIGILLTVNTMEITTDMLVVLRTSTTHSKVTMRNTRPIMKNQLIT